MLVSRTKGFVFQTFKFMLEPIFRENYVVSLDLHVQLQLVTEKNLQVMKQVLYYKD